jgi:hypothetical protein
MPIDVWDTEANRRVVHDDANINTTGTEKDE